MNELIEIVQAFLSIINPDLNRKIGDVKEDASKGVAGNLTHTQAGHMTEHKLGVVFSEDDWSILLAGPSLLDTAKATKKEESILSLDLTFNTNQQEGKNQPEVNFKDFPLSPPSIDNNPKSTPRFA